MDMYGKALDLPNFFLFDGPNSIGGGVMQNSASDCIMTALIAARYRAVDKLKCETHKGIHPSHFLERLVAYTSEEAHSCVQKAAKIAIIELRVLPTDEHGSLRGRTLAEAIEADIKRNKIPVFVSATVGTTGTCAFDNLREIGDVCKKYPDIWFHVDGAYAGNSFILPEMRKFKEGLEYADSFNTNTNKFLLTSFDASCLWVKSANDLKKSLVVDPIYLQTSGSAEKGDELRHYGIPLSRRFRSLKLWFVLRSYGLNGLRSYMRNHIKMAQYFQSLIHCDNRFSVENNVVLGLVCFRLLVNDTLENINSVNMELLERMNESGEIHMIPTKFHERFIIRFCVTNEHATEKEIGLYSMTLFLFVFLIFEFYSCNDMRFRFSFNRRSSLGNHSEICMRCTQ